MGIFRFIKNTIEANVTEGMADEYYAQGFRFYQRACEELPFGARPVERCSRAYGIFLKEERAGGPLSARLITPPQFHPAIAQFACLPHPECGEALSLALLNERYPIIAKRFAKYENRLGEIAIEVFMAHQSSDWEKLNAMFHAANPNYPIDGPFPISW